MNVRNLYSFDLDKLQFCFALVYTQWKVRKPWSIITAFCEKNLWSILLLSLLLYILEYSNQIISFYFQIILDFWLLLCHHRPNSNCWWIGEGVSFYFNIFFLHIWQNSLLKSNLIEKHYLRKSKVLFLMKIICGNWMISSVNSFSQIK